MHSVPEDSVDLLFPSDPRNVVETGEHTSGVFDDCDPVVHHVLTLWEVEHQVLEEDALKFGVHDLSSGSIFLGLLVVGGVAPFTALGQLKTRPRQHYRGLVDLFGGHHHIVVLGGSVLVLEGLHQPAHIDNMNISTSLEPGVVGI